MHSALSLEHFWVDKSKYDNAERLYHEAKAKALRDQQEKDKVLLVEKTNCTVEDPVAVPIANTFTMEQAVAVPIGNDFALEQAVAVPIANDCALEQAIAVPIANDCALEQAIAVPIANDSALEKAIAARKAKNSARNKRRRAAKKSRAENNKVLPMSQTNTLVSEITNARKHIQNSLEKMDGITNLISSLGCNQLVNRIVSIEKENKELKNLYEQLSSLYIESQRRIKALEEKANDAVVPYKYKGEPYDVGDDDVYGSGSENEFEAQERAARLDLYANLRMHAPYLNKKSCAVLDVTPWSGYVDLREMEYQIRKIYLDGLLWGPSKIVPIGYGLKKLTISCILDDGKLTSASVAESVGKLFDFVERIEVAEVNEM